MKKIIEKCPYCNYGPDIGPINSKKWAASCDFGPNAHYIRVEGNSKAEAIRLWNKEVHKIREIRDL